MRIGIDIDGVLTDIERWQLDYASKYAFENNLGYIIDACSYDTNKMFNWSNDEGYKFWEKYLMDYCKNEKVRPFASEVIKRLKKDGNEIFIITARTFTAEDTKNGKIMRNIVCKWLKKNNIYYDKIIFSSEDKRKNCIDNKIDIMIEDCEKNIMELSEVLPKIICFDTRYNQKCNKENIIRAYSWYDIYYKINNL